MTKNYPEAKKPIVSFGRAIAKKYPAAYKREHKLRKITCKRNEKKIITAYCLTNTYSMHARKKSEHKIEHISLYMLLGYHSEQWNLLFIQKRAHS